MARTLWKGAISFGLVHIPIALHPATRSARLDFDWIDKRDDAPVGYQRINKRTGKAIAAEHIVRGYEYEKGDYVYLSDEDFRRANDVATQTIEILGFVQAAEVPLYYYDTPYYLEPDKRGGPGYVLLRDALRKSGRLALGQVVLHTRQHLAALLPQGDALMMVTLRYAEEIREAPELDLPAKHAGARETDMALRLIDDMSVDWDPAQYHDAYREDLLAAIRAKIKAGKTHSLTEAETPAPARDSAKVLDLMAMLKQSIEQGRRTPAASARAASPRKTAKGRPAAKTAAKTAARKASKTPAKAARKTAAKTPRRKAA
ncbi:non-homologous end joining protein Ku [Bordetella hinzii]|uniref:non-homologous end joining protein Ku n=1 Tax=Bordetella hinzii TaxID=103855 RepID=UPI00045AECF1|nr:Ku protein [Bordetella hinzii]KCB46000.1 Ku protein [Bordetella hinzii 4161]KXA71475.1 DNA repair protein [Bordetella hinzii LMG 13501]QDJ38665.1 Ku protein [Bordetella hinzii]QDJ47734.1 Ku protein [Bordetella hinzii]QWF38607.1 Ku protein [Bordetella hinzii]